jgi:hypothetical protein
MEKITEYLTNIYDNYMFEDQANMGITYKAKCLGAMEALLVILGVLKAGQPLNYVEIEKKFLILWLFPYKYKRKEKYPEHILRLVNETLKKK